ncbi:hypothetical protein [Micromonospora narathiwatensis]|uniref:Uncharacterized protein n=1 Tax=Micromonospora narathiwatensis TaxID=299146 RepID=A0A1A8YZR6_9ACTN|nr:hypothetical protein [Micromonospora narathiwatensis]SBT37105.1 hypothetical protein GA0070621_0032 [Micromonospora narathiwatensis]
MNDYSLVVGLLDERQSFEQLVDVVAVATGATVTDLPGEKPSVEGALPTGHFWVEFDPADIEPFASNPYVIDVTLTDPSAEPRLAETIFAALVAHGYRVAILENGGVIRASHHVEESVADGAGGNGGQAEPSK